MLLHVDGARLANAAASLDVPLARDHHRRRRRPRSPSARTKNGAVVRRGGRLPATRASARASSSSASSWLSSRRRCASSPPSSRSCSATASSGAASAVHANAMAARLADAVTAIDGVEIVHPVAGQRRLRPPDRDRDRPPARRLALRAPLLRLGRGRERRPLDVLLGHDSRGRRRLRGRGRRRGGPDKRARATRDSLCRWPGCGRGLRSGSCASSRRCRRASPACSPGGRCGSRARSCNPRVQLLLKVDKLVGGLEADAADGAAGAAPPPSAGVSRQGDRGRRGLGSRDPDRRGGDPGPPLRARRGAGGRAAGRLLPRRRPRDRRPRHARPAVSLPRPGDPGGGARDRLPPRPRAPVPGRGR